MRNEISSTEIKVNLKSKLKDEKYWGLKLQFVLLILIISLIIFKLSTCNSNIKEIKKPLIENTSLEKTEGLKIIPQSVEFSVMSSDPTEAHQKFKTEFIKNTDPNQSYDFVSLNQFYLNGLYTFKIKLKTSNDGFKNFTLIFNPINTPPISKNNVLSKNIGSQVVNQGVINSFDSYLIGLK